MVTDMGDLGFPGSSGGKEPACQCKNIRDAGSIPGSGRSSGGRAWQSTPVFLPGESHGQGAWRASP